jgi:hypothetical protein
MGIFWGVGREATVFLSGDGLRLAEVVAHLIILLRSILSTYCRFTIRSDAVSS